MLLIRNLKSWNSSLIIGLLLAQILALILLSSYVTASTGNTIYVSTTGDNRNSGSQSQPLRSIQRAIDIAQAGDTIYVRGGTYHEALLITKSGTAQRPLRLYAFPGELPVLDGRYNLPTGATGGCSNVAPKHCFVYQPLVSFRGSHWEFSGFKIIRSQGRGIGVSSRPGTKTRNILIDSCLVDNVRSSGIHVLNSAHVTVQRCSVASAGNFATHARSAQELNWPVIVNVVGSDHVTLRKNKIHENWGEGAAAGRNSTHVTIEDNVIFDNYALQVYVQRSQDILVQRNLVYHTNAAQFRRGGNPSSCIVVNNENGFSGSLVTNRVKVMNNITTGCGQGIAIWGNSGTAIRTSNVEISHNIAANAVRNTTSAPVGILVNPKTQLQNVKVHNNIVLQNEGHPVYLPSSDHVRVNNNIWSTSPKAGGRGSNNRVADPQLKDPYQTLRPNQVQVDWFKPKNSSPALAMGAGPYEYVDVSKAGMPAAGSPPVAPSIRPTSTPEPTATTVPAPTSAPPVENSTSSAPQVLYDFAENEGTMVRDISNNGDRVDLAISDLGAVRWRPDGLQVLRSVTIKSTQPAIKLADACRDSDELTIDMSITPASVQQDGPARILSLSSSTLRRNFTIGHGQWKNRPKDVYDIRLRTAATNANGEPSLVSERGSVTTAKTHLFYTRGRDGKTNLYVNGAMVATGRVLGDLDSWNRGYSLHLGNEATGDRPWLGTYHRLAIYCQTLDPAQITAASTNKEGTADLTDLLNEPAPSPDELDATTAQLDGFLRIFELSPDGNLLEPNVFLPVVGE